jgi:hypothetical protein
MSQHELHPEMRFRKRIKQKIDTEKSLISVIWFANGIHSLVDIPKGTTYNSALFCDYVVPDLAEECFTHNQRRTLKVIFLHLDNAHHHNSKQSCECFEGFRTVEFHIRHTTRIWRQMTSSSLGI